MQTITVSSSTTTVVNRSKFLTHLVPISEYEGLQAQLKLEHPKANHVVYALRSINEYEQIVENSSDDGEPKGCAGVPALNVLRGVELVNCAVLIVRYFGGIKLGTGGMARAYALAVKEALEEATLLPYEKLHHYSFSSSYADVDKILYRLKKLEIHSYERDFGIHEVSWHITASAAAIEAFQSEA